MKVKSGAAVGLEFLDLTAYPGIRAIVKCFIPVFSLGQNRPWALGCSVLDTSNPLKPKSYNHCPINPSSYKPLNP